MVTQLPDKLYLQLENGAVFEGFAFGADEPALGEIVFSTGMTGYLETLTDKSYYGQIIVQTFPLIGNYGVIPPDFEAGAVSARGYIVKSWCQAPSNFRNEGDLDTFLKQQGIPGLYGIDTRALTRMIRENGVMNGRLTKDLCAPGFEEMCAYQVTGAVAGVSTKKVYTVNETGAPHIALMDYGLKESIVKNLAKRGCRVTVFPHDTKAEAVLAEKPDGIMLSNGPGDPAKNPEVIAELRVLLDCGLPVFGICLGHQLTALAIGAKTEKMKYGHRGANQPVREYSSGRVYITSQNHGYAVCADSIDGRVARMSFVNVNDGTCEGLEFLNAPIFTVQFHPEASAGPLDTEFLFDRFLSNIKNSKGGGVSAAE